ICCNFSSWPKPPICSWKNCRPRPCSKWPKWVTRPCVCSEWQNDDKNFWLMTSEITEITEIKEGRSPDRPAAPWEKSFRGWILYDGACRSCTASARRFGRIFRRRGFLFLPLQTNWVMKRFDLEPGAPLDEMRVLTADGRDIDGGDAVIFLARHIWWAWPFAALARLLGMHKLLNRGYRWIAAHRGCNHIACSLPPQRRWPGWIALIVLPVLALLVRDRVAPWVFMWLIAAAIFDPALAAALVLASLFCFHGVTWGRVECWNRDQMAMRNLAGLRPGDY